MRKNVKVEGSEELRQAGTFFTSFFPYNTLKFTSANISAFEINAA